MIGLGEAKLRDCPELVEGLRIPLPIQVRGQYMKL